MKKYLVIGNPIEHSLSPKLHNHWIGENNIDAIYDKKQLNELAPFNLIWGSGFNMNSINAEINWLCEWGKGRWINNVEIGRFSHKINKIRLIDVNVNWFVSVNDKSNNDGKWISQNNSSKMNVSSMMDPYLNYYWKFGIIGIIWHFGRTRRFAD